MEVPVANFNTYEVAEKSFEALKANAKKFYRFETPSGVIALVLAAASKLVAGKDEEAASLLRKGEAELKRALRALINVNPAATLVGIRQHLEPEHYRRLERVIALYQNDVKGLGWIPAAIKYNSVMTLLEKAPAESAKIRAANEAARAAENRRKCEELDRLAAEKKAIAAHAQRIKAAERLRSLVAA